MKRLRSVMQLDLLQATTAPLKTQIITPLFYKVTSSSIISRPSSAVGAVVPSSTQLRSVHRPIFAQHQLCPMHLETIRG